MKSLNSHQQKVIQREPNVAHPGNLLWKSKFSTNDLRTVQLIRRSSYFLVSAYSGRPMQIIAILHRKTSFVSVPSKRFLSSISARHLNIFYFLPRYSLSIYLESGVDAQRTKGAWKKSNILQFKPWDQILGNHVIFSAIQPDGWKGKLWLQFVQIATHRSKLATICTLRIQSVYMKCTRRCDTESWRSGFLVGNCF